MNCYAVYVIITIIPIHVAAYYCPLQVRRLSLDGYDLVFNGWLAWGAWGSCDHTCGGGIRVRTRHCGAWRNPNNTLKVYYTEHDQSSCRQTCSDRGRYVNGKCHCKPEAKGYCCEVIPVCRPVCENNGSCIADDTCKCLPGYYGQRCEIGGNFNELLFPQLLPALPVDDLYKPLSWYDSPDYGSDNEVCFVKVHTQGAPNDTILTAESIAANGTTKPFGNYSAGPIDSSAKIDGSSRFACLQVRCPGTHSTENDVIVNVSLETRYKRCHIRKQSQHLISVNVSSNQLGSDSFKIVLENGINYGPSYGIYFNTGYLDKAIYLAKSTCYSGHSYDFRHFNPSTGIVAEYICS